jgi:hypothetical protein
MSAFYKNGREMLTLSLSVAHLGQNTATLNGRNLSFQSAQSAGGAAG